MLWRLWESVVLSLWPWLADPHLAPRYCKELGDKKKQKVAPPAGWEDKRCAICEHKTTEPCFLDRSENKGTPSTRKWGLRFLLGGPMLVVLKDVYH